MRDNICATKSPGESNALWIPVQPGLFEYPLTKGQTPALLANRCSKCGKSFFPKRTLCPHCFDQGSMENISVSGRGIIYACTVVHIPSPAGIEAPYAYGYIEMPANRLRIFGLLTGGDPSSYAPGQEVELTLEAIRVNEKGQEIIGCKFKIVP